MRAVHALPIFEVRATSDFSASVHFGRPPSLLGLGAQQGWLRWTNNVSRQPGLIDYKRTDMLG